MVEKFKEVWKEMLLMHGSTIAICVSASTFLLLNTTQFTRQQLRREADILSDRINHIEERLGNLQDRSPSPSTETQNDGKDSSS